LFVSGACGGFLERHKARGKGVRSCHLRCWRGRAGEPQLSAGADVCGRGGGGLTANPTGAGLVGRSIRGISGRICRYTGLLVCRFTSAPVRRYVGLPTCRYTGAPMHRSTNAPVFRFNRNVSKALERHNNIYRARLPSVRLHANRLKSTALISEFNSTQHVLTGDPRPRKFNQTRSSRQMNSRVLGLRQNLQTPI
jgi:hypothetical protein